MTGYDVVAARSGGRCEIQAAPGCTGHGEQMHHRRPRGMGGSRRKDTNTAVNLIHICHVCHVYVESHRSEAFQNGWLVSQALQPEDAPVRIYGVLVFLREDGGMDRVNLDLGDIFSLDIPTSNG